MRRRLQGLSRSRTTTDIPDGLYLVRVQRAHYRWHKYKPFYEFGFYVLEPKALVGAAITARLHCFPKTLWKFAWFLRDFRYSQELLEQDEIDAKAIVGLQGIVQIASDVASGRTEVCLQGFAPATDWEHLANGVIPRPEVA